MYPHAFSQSNKKLQPLSIPLRPMEMPTEAVGSGSELRHPPKKP